MRPTQCYKIKLSGKSEKYSYDGVVTDFKVAMHSYSEPTNFKLSEKTDKTLTVNWLDPEYRFFDGKKNYSYVISIKPKDSYDGPQELPKLRIDSKEHGKEILGLEASKEYEISIETKSKVKSDVICSTDYIKVTWVPLNATLTATTRLLTPIAPNITNITETSALVKWDESKVPSVNDTAWYTIEYRRIDPNTTKDYLPNSVDIRRTKGLSMKLKNLAAGAVYKIHMTVDTDLLGESEKSPAVIITTIALTNASTRDLRENLKIIKGENEMTGDYSIICIMLRIHLQVL